MTSSFGQVIGTERDEIPDISSTNYNRTDPNLDEANKRAIERNIEDTQQFYSTMKELARIQAETPMKNFEQLAAFSSSLANYKLVSEEFEEARKLKQEGRDAYESGIDVFGDEQTEFNYDNAVFTSELFNEGTFESRELLAAELNIPTEYEDLDDFFQQIKTSMLSARYTTLQDSGWWNSPTVSEALNIHEAADERMIAAYIHLAHEANFDVTSPAFKKHFIKNVYPLLKEKQDTNMEFFTRNRDENIANRMEADLKKNIISAILNKDSLDQDKEILDIIERLNPDVETPAEAITYLFEVAGTAFQEGELANDDLNWLRYVHEWTRKSDGEKVFFDDLGLKNTSQILQTLSEKIEGGLSDPAEILEQNLELFIANEIADKLELEGVDNWSNLSYRSQVELTALFVTRNPSIGGTGGLLPMIFQNGLANSIVKVDDLFGNNNLADVMVRNFEHSEFLPSLEKRYFDSLFDEDPTVTIASINDLNMTQQLTWRALQRGFIEQFGIIMDAKNVQPEVAAREAMEFVMNNLKSGEYTFPEELTLETSATTAINYATLINNDPSLLTNSEFINTAEKLEILKSIEEFKRTGRISPFFHNAALEIDGKNGFQVFIDRVNALGLLDEEGRKFLNDKEGVQLTPDELDHLNRVDTPNAGLDIIYSNRDSAEIIFNAARQTRINEDGEEVYLEDGYIEFEGVFGGFSEQFTADNRTFKDLVGTNLKRVGRYGFTQEELEEAFNYIPEGGTEPLLKEFHNSEFDENLQTQIALVLWKVRVNQGNAMRGSSIDGETFWRLSDIRESESIILNEFFSGLKDVNAYANWNHLQVDAARLFVTDKETAKANALDTDLITPEDISNFVTENEIEYSSYEFYDGTNEGYGREILPEDFTFKDLNREDQEKLLRKLNLEFKEVDGIETIVPNESYIRTQERIEAVQETLETSKTNISDLLNNSLSNILNFNTEETDDTNEIDTGNENE